MRENDRRGNVMYKWNIPGMRGAEKVAVYSLVHCSCLFLLNSVKIVMMVSFTTVYIFGADISFLS